MKWFQVDSDSPNDPKIKALIRKGLTDGGPGRAAALVGHTFLLWAYIANHGEGVPGHGVKADGSPLSLVEMADECLFDGVDQLRAHVDFLAEKEHVDPTAWALGIVSLPAMRTRADAYARSKGRGDSGPDRGNAGGSDTGRGKSGKSGRKVAQAGPKLPLHNTTKQDTTPPEDPGSADLLAGAGEDNVDALVRIWNTERKPGPTVRDVTPQRRERYLRALKARPDLADWRLVIGWLNGQKWCNAGGTGDHPTWRADLDWLAKPGNLARYHEKAIAERPARADGVVGRAKGRTGYKPGEFAAALGGNDGPVH